VHEENISLSCCFVVSCLSSSLLELILNIAHYMDMRIFLDYFNERVRSVLKWRLRISEEGNRGFKRVIGGWILPLCVN
jgi:hypothetical protein